MVDDKTNLTIVILLTSAALCMYLIGLCFHVKVIQVSQKDQEMTWKLDITNSGVQLFRGFNIIFMHSITWFVKDLYLYTGEWFCYTTKVVTYYLNFFTIGHSLVVSMLKYIIIVHWDKAHKYGKDRIIELFFWLNFLHPSIMILFQLIIRPNFFWAYDGFPQIDRCLGDPKHNWEPGSNKSLNKLHNLCDFMEPNHDNHLEYIIYICRTLGCGVSVVVFYSVLWNVFELFFYCKIFGFMRG